MIGAVTGSGRERQALLRSSHCRLKGACMGKGSKAVTPTIGKYTVYNAT
jgi:hypothetical protein